MHGRFWRLDIYMKVALKVVLDTVLSLQIVERACHAWRVLET